MTRVYDVVYVIYITNTNFTLQTFEHNFKTNESYHFHLLEDIMLARETSLVNHFYNLVLSVCHNEFEILYGYLQVHAHVSLMYMMIASFPYFFQVYLYMCYSLILLQHWPLDMVSVHVATMLCYYL